MLIYKQHKLRIFVDFSFTLGSLMVVRIYLTILINTDKINPINLIRFSKEALTYKLQLAILAKLQNSVIPAVYFVSLGLNGQN